ncbi:HlyD family secretion protein [Paenibacillus sp. GCM10023248]|uniref:HlyD family secretion protein n=1 Tax=Bacillales TaxID=1385 RepID=UPI0023788788|nr:MULTISPECIES: HlyD family efflux transporter periplasmic adaptor subunit [Bacillales]MDD9272263.1 HlyD family efflux transporter periplasmic adaptor subunit [Paenibacillus sp. MAHUQ-63]MDR6885388.1 HlyD family secretion protein [Bacillus sp. 3255]
MRFIRPMVYSVMAVVIGTSAFLLTTREATSQSDAANQLHPTAYIESNEVSASFKVGGRVTEILVKEGDTVKKGQVLARLQSAEIEAKVEQAKAAVALAQGKIAEAQGATATAQAKKQQGIAGVTVTADTAEQQVAQAQAAVNAAQAKVDALKSGARPEEKKQAEIQFQAASEVYALAEQNLNRMNALLEQGLVSQADVDKVKISYEEAKTKRDLAQQQLNMANQGPREEEIRGAEALLEQAKASLKLAEANRGTVQVRQGDVKAAEAAVQQAQGAVKSAQSGEQQAKAAQLEAETYLSYTELVAPADGVVLYQSAQVGELVGSGFPVFSLESAEKRWAKFYLPETHIAGLQAGSKISMKMLSTGEEIVGTITSVAAAPDFAIKKATQTSGETDIRSFGIKIDLSALPDTATTGMTLQWNGKTEG